MTIRIHKIYQKLNHEYAPVKLPKALRGISKVVGLCSAVVCACIGGFPLIAYAVPATLISSDAEVYEQADEESNTIGNLVEGSTFEYMGDVTAEDGSVWYQITTADGTVGYIRGDREIETEGEEQTPEEGQTVGEQENPAEDSNNPASIENLPEENPEGREEGAGEDEETPEGENEEDPENSEAADGIDGQLQNNQSKKYWLRDSANIKEGENLTKTNTAEGRTESKRVQRDVTTLFGGALIFFCTGMAYFSCFKIKKLVKRGGYKGEPEYRKKHGSEKPKKKKHSRKRKTRNGKNHGESSNVRKAGRGDGK